MSDDRTMKQQIEQILLEQIETVTDRVVAMRDKRIEVYELIDAMTSSAAASPDEGTLTHTQQHLIIEALQVFLDHLQERIFIDEKRIKRLREGLASPSSIILFENPIDHEGEAHA